jgi:hypothetical protein
MPAAPARGLLDFKAGKMHYDKDMQFSQMQARSSNMLGLFFYFQK